MLIDAPPSASAAPIFAGDPEVDLLALGLPAAASVWRTGMAQPRELHGTATLVRTRHRACETDRSWLRVDVHRLAPEHASVLIHERLPRAASLPARDLYPASHGLLR